MERIFRRFLCLMIFSLLVSAGGIAPSQTLSTFMVFDEPASGLPIKSSHTEQLQAAYSVADRPQVALIRQVSLPLITQGCLAGRSFSTLRRTSPRYTSVAVSFINYYPGGLSPPPRPSTVI